MRCINKVKKTVKPRKGQTKEEAAWGICVKRTGQKPHKKKKRRDSVEEVPFSLRDAKKCKKKKKKKKQYDSTPNTGYISFSNDNVPFIYRGGEYGI